MSFTFSIGYRTPISSTSFNEKLHEVWGRNGVISGLSISRYSNNQVKLDSGIGIVRGVKVEYIEDNPGNPLRINIPTQNDGTLYVYGLYNHKLSAFTLHTTLNKESAQGGWKIFLGHANVASGEISSVQPISEPSVSELEGIYKRLPNLNEIIDMFYETTIEINNQVNKLMNDVVGDMKELKTEHKDTVVGSINELFDTKEPNLTRDRIFELIGGGSGGNIDIDSINKIPIDRFVLDDRAIRTLENSGLIGGGNLSQDRNLEINWGDGEYQVPRGTHNHTGYHVDKQFLSDFGSRNIAAVYTQLAYYSRTTNGTGMIKIVLPKEFTGASLSIELKGHDSSSSSSAFTLQLGGTMSLSSKSWLSCTANILGTAPFTKVSFVRDEATQKPCILLGTPTTAWGKGSLFIDKVLVYNDSSGTWKDGWSIEMIQSMNGLTLQDSPKIMTGGPQTGEYVPPNRGIIAGTGLTGGGSLSNDITLSVNFGNSWSTVARGNHEHSQYLNKNIGSRNGIVVTDGSGNIKVDDLIWDYELRRLSGIRDNVQRQLDNKSNNGHGHNEYFPRTGGQMGGAVNMAWHWFNSDNCHINGARVSVSQSAPSPEGWGHIWIQLT